MIEEMSMNNPLIQLMEKYRRGNRSAFHVGPFLPLTRIRERGLPFNDIMRESQAMIEAALMSFEFGFETTVLPFDLNVEAEILGAKVLYHEGFDGNPVYPTITEKPVATVEDIAIPDDLSERGRMPVILKSIQSIKEQAQDKGAIGAFMSGPFTLAGQVMDMDELFVMLLKQPEPTRMIFEKLTEFILKLKDVYIRAGIDFIMVVEGGGAAISPKAFRDMLLPCIQDIFKSNEVPQIVYSFGSSEKYVELMLACDPDGIVLEKECGVERARELIPESIPIIGECGRFDMLANATPAEITEKVHRYLDMGFTTVGPPADIYPPARIENIEAFVRAIQEYKKIFCY
jgi:[methyl-Co(III) methanol/glycine betaine-specific corrinoid protein]:coenzyme M methyltransferase